MTRSLLILAVLLLTTPAWLTGCGGGDGQPSVSSLAAQLLEQLPVIDPEATCEKLETAGSYRCTVTGKASSTTLTYTVSCGAETCVAKDEDGGPSLTFALKTG